jgi:multidrug efflux pump subunit AcrB
VTVELDPPALEARGLDPLRVQAALSRANVRVHRRDDRVERQQEHDCRGGQLASHRLRRSALLSLGESSGVPIRLGDVATVLDGGAEPTDYVAFHASATTSHPAVTLSIAKRKGVNAIDLTRRRRPQDRGAPRVPAAFAT